MIREFFQPDTIIKALQLRRDNKRSTLLAGGTDFVVALHKDMETEGSIIDLSKVKRLKGIEVEGDMIKIGPMTNFTDLSDSKILKDVADMLCQAGNTIGSPQIRNRGTIGGNICHASPAADGITPLLCLDAEIEIQSITADDIIQTRMLLLEDFVLGTKKTALQDNEIMVGIQFQRPLPDTFSSFQKIGRRNALAVARINGSCILRLNNNFVESIQFALGASTSKPERIRVVEELLTGVELTKEALNQAGKQAAAYVLKQTGTRASSSYKLPVIEKFTVSLIETTMERSMNR